MCKRYKYDEASHTYWHDDSRIPSVTEIIKRFIRFNHASKEAMEFGKNVHKATQLLDNEQLDWSSVDSDIKKRLEAWVEFKQIFEWENLFIEQQMMYFEYSLMMNFAGTVDRIGISSKIGPGSTVLEIKVSDSTILTASLQTAMYSSLYTYTWPQFIKDAKEYKRPQNRCAVYLRSDGRFKPQRDLKIFKESYDFEVGRNMIFIYNWMISKKIGGYNE